MRISIRMDDITPDMDWTKFLRFKELCDLYQVKPLIGVVPDNQDANLHIDTSEPAFIGEFWKYIKVLENEGWCIAQHGVTHVYTTKKMGCFPLNRLSELAGTGYTNQFAVLKRGRDIFLAHGIKTEIFMAPAHSFDFNTIKALRKLGFSKMTDGFGKRPYLWRGITFYPISYKQSSCLKKNRGYTTFVVHSNTMDDKDFAHYEKLFAKYKDRLISYTELMAVGAKKRGVFGKAAEYTMALTKYILVSGKRIFKELRR